MEKLYIGHYNSPIGLMKIKADEKHIIALDFTDSKETTCENLVINQCINELEEYFRGIRRDFHVPIRFTSGTDFQQKVWRTLTTISYGETLSYKEVASIIGNEKAVRAVGGANNKNSIAIIVPCHRVIGSKGNLIGYAGGLWRKEWLLKHEKNNLK